MVAAALLCGCGAADGATELVGIGASSQSAAMEGWKAGYGERTLGVEVVYDPVGSGGGREAFLAGAAHFAGSDAALDDEEYAASIRSCAGGLGAINLPVYISPIAVMYNLPSIEGHTLNLTPDTVAAIFAGAITRWDDPMIAAHNPGLPLPSTAINPVHRSDESGTTKNFTQYLAAVAPTAWRYGVFESWDVGPPGGEGASGTAGVVGAVSVGVGSIGYGDASLLGDLPAAAILVGDEFVQSTAEAAAAVVRASPRVEGRGEHDFTFDLQRDLPGTYPIVLVSYQIACLRYADTATAEQVRRFLSFVVSPDGQALANLSAGSAPLPDDVAARMAAAVAAIAGE